MGVACRDSNSQHIYIFEMWPFMFSSIIIMFIKSAE